jgi:UPF0271 protein
VKQSIDLNSDMGEGFGPWTIGDGVDTEIMPLVTSANIAAGFHAGDPHIMRRMVMLARGHDVGVGVHPGFRDLVGFGRRHIQASAEELVSDILYQIGALREFARLAAVPLRHVKLHGALYMHAARDVAMSQAFIGALQVTEPHLPVLCMEASATYRVARQEGYPVVREFYADRDYGNDGSIVFTRRVGTLDPNKVAERVGRACTEGLVRTIDGSDLQIDFDSVCIHSDTPGALQMVKATRAVLAGHSIEIRRFHTPWADAHVRDT